MPKSKPGPDTARCACGRRSVDAAIYTFRSHTDRYVFHRCECGREWTEHQSGVDPTEPVSTDEVLEVHEKLAGFKGSLPDLFGLSKA